MSTSGNKILWKVVPEPFTSHAFVVKRTAVLFSSMQTPEIGMTSVTFFLTAFNHIMDLAASWCNVSKGYEMS